MVQLYEGLEGQDMQRKQRNSKPMPYEFASAMEETVKAHSTADQQDTASLRALSPEERAVLIERACEAAAAIERSRLAAGLPNAAPNPWPASTWDFLREHASHAHTEKG